MLNLCQPRFVKPSTAVLLACVFLFGCDDQSTISTTVEKMDPEESGYFEAFGEAITEVVNLGHTYIMRCNRLPEHTTDAKEDRARKRIIEDFNDLKTLTVILPALKSTLSPPKMSILHERFVNVLEATTAVMHDEKCIDNDTLRLACDLFIQEEARVAIEIEHRRPTNVPSFFKIELRPPGSPLKIDLVDGTITVAPRIKVRLVGTITISRRQNEGVKLLVIRSNARDRYFSIGDRTFEMPVEASMLKVEGSKITLDIDAFKNHSPD